MVAALAIVPSVHAQVVTLVSNTGQVDTAIGFYTDTQQRAQQFTTGDHAGGYTLSEVVVDIGRPCSIAPAFALHSSTTAGGRLEVPGAEIVGLVGSAASRGEQSFAPATATRLARSTRYFVLFKTAATASSADCKVARTISSSVDAGAASGWDIAGTAVFSPDAGTTWTNTPSSPEDPPPPVQIAIRGSLIQTSTALGRPRNLTATPGNGRVTLRWERPSDDGGSPVTGYEYRHAQGSSVPSNTSWRSAGLDQERTIAGLTNGLRYAFEVRAVNRVGPGPADRVVGTPVGAPGEPGAPEELAAIAGDASVVLSWTAPSDDGGSPVTGYEYRHAQGSSVPSNTSWRSAGLDQERTIAGLTNGLRYAFEVRAVNRVGPGPADRVVGTPVGAPGAPEELAAIPGDASVVLSWTAPLDDGGAPVTGYEYRHVARCLRTRPGDPPGWTRSGPSPV